MAEKGKGKGVNGNLIPASSRTESELREMTRNGGIKSGESRRRKKTMREALEMMLYQTKLNEQTKKMLQAEGVQSADDFNHQMVITRSLIAKAEAGDVQAYNAICGMIGEKPADKVEMSGGIDCNVTIEFVHVEKDPVSSEDEIED